MWNFPLAIHPDLHVTTKGFRMGQSPIYVPYGSDPRTVLSSTLKVEVFERFYVPIFSVGWAETND